MSREHESYATPLDKGPRVATLAKRCGVKTIDMRLVLAELGQPARNGLVRLEPIFAQTLEDSGLIQEIVRE